MRRFGIEQVVQSAPGGFHRRGGERPPGGFFRLDEAVRVSRHIALARLDEEESLTARLLSAQLFLEHL